MADNPTIGSGASTPVDVPVEGDDIGAGVIRQGVVIAWGAKDASSRVTTSSPLPVGDAGGSLTVDAVSLPLPTGAATETSAAASAAAAGTTGDAAYASGSGTIVAILKGIFGKLPALVSGRVPVDGSGVTQPVSLASQPLPTGASTETTLAAVSTTLGSTTDIPALSVGSVIAQLRRIANAVGLADNAAFTDGTTPLTPAGYVFDEVAGTALTENDAAAARIDSKRSQVGVLEDATTRGQRLAVSAAGAAKVDGSAVTQPISAASLPLPTGAALDSSVTAHNALLGAVAETAPTTDTASSGLNGRLQRIAQRLTSLIAQIPATLGQKAMSASLAVAIASDQSTLPVVQSGATLNAGARVTATTTAGTLIAAAAARKQLTIRALSANTDSVYFGPATVTALIGMEIKPGEIASFGPGEAPTNLVQVIAGSGSQIVIVQDSV